MKMITYQKKLISFFVSLVTYLMIIILFNYYVDPGNQFSEAASYEKKLSDSLLANHSVMTQVNYDDRSLQKIMLNRSSLHADTLILGSSRIMALDQNQFKNAAIYNAAVPSATLEDDIAFYYLYTKNSPPPKMVVICLDPWILQKDVEPRWKNALSTEYHAAMHALFDSKVNNNVFDKWKTGLDKYSQLLSLDYFKASFKKIKIINSVSSTEIIVDNDNAHYPAYAMRKPNGVRLPSYQDEEVTAEKADLSGVERIKELSEEYKGFTRLDTAYMDLFNNFIHYMQSQHIKVVLYLPPYEPVAYASMQQDPHYKMINAAEKFFVSYANENGLKIIGSYNPNKNNMLASDFVDYYHLKKRGIDKIFQNQLLG